jgi:TRAP transporter 4TM/12TM fusion protein
MDSRINKNKNLLRVLDTLFFVIGLVLIFYLGATTISLFQEAVQHYATFVLVVFVLVGLATIRNIINDDSQGFKFWFRLCLFGLASMVAVFTAAYLRYHAIRLNMIQPFFTDQDLVVGWFLLGSMLLLTWFHWGTLLTSMIALSILYMFVGHLIPSQLLGHGEFSLSFAMSYMGMDIVSGLFWFVPLAADKIFFLVMFAALLLGIGMLSLVMEIGKLVGRRVKGGAAFPAIIGSAMTGAVMGQAVSNTMLTGQLTIPMMKRHGMNPNFAGAVEAVASTSGQFMPPILGLAAFIIAAFLNMPYIEVAMAATLPAFLFIGTVFVAVLIAARLFGLGYLEEPINMKIIFRMFPTFFVSFTLVLVLLFLYYSPNVAALAGIISMLAISFFQGKEFRPRLKTFTDSFRSGLNVCTVLSLLLVAIGPLCQMATTTDIASKLSTLLAMTLAHNIPLILVGAMIISIFLGMGLPTPVAYLLVAITIAPFLQELGVPVFVSHMFGFYFAIFSTVSPPVAISCLAASKISGGTFLGTVRESLRLSLPTFIIPFAFAFNPDLFTFPKVTLNGLIAFFLTFFCQFCLVVALYGFLFRRLNVVERILFGITSAFGIWYLIYHSTFFLVMFLSLGMGVILWNFANSRQAVPEKIVAEEA